MSKSFEAFLNGLGSDTQALYILGDLFEVWLGDDSILPAYQSNIEVLRKLTLTGIPVYFMHGNRDFLIGSEFESLTGCTLLQDPTVIDLYGTPTLLMHGDLLCTDDTEYMKFRQLVRNPQWQQHFLSLPLTERIAAAREARSQSKQQTQNKSMEIMDVNLNTLKQYMQRYQVQHIIHGHTHRPAIHSFEHNSLPAQRIVLGDWTDKISSHLTVSADSTILFDPRVR